MISILWELRVSASLNLYIFCGQVTKQQEMYSFRHLVLKLYILLGCDLFKFGKKLQVVPVP